MAIWDIIEQCQALRKARQAFALATVVYCQRPVSAHLGDQAVIRPDGHMTGWIGGSCTEPTVVREAVRAMREGRNCLVRLGPADSLPAVLPDGMVAFPMTCHSGGTLEVFLDVALPERQLVLVGHSPVIAALASLAATTGLSVVVCDPDATADLFPQAGQIAPDIAAPGILLDDRTHIVVATHGIDDEEALAVALRSDAGYVALVSSRKRADVTRATLLDMGVPAERIARLRAPAGLDLGGESHAEIAVSILAEIIQYDHSAAAKHAEAAAVESSLPAEPETAIDPVCGMTVEIVEGALTASYQGLPYYFCSTGCRRQFERDPERFLTAAESSH